MGQSLRALGCVAVRFSMSAFRHTGGFLVQRHCGYIISGICVGDLCCMRLALAQDTFVDPKDSRVLVTAAVRDCKSIIQSIRPTPRAAIHCRTRHPLLSVCFLHVLLGALLRSKPRQ